MEKYKNDVLLTTQTMSPNLTGVRARHALASMVNAKEAGYRLLVSDGSPIDVRDEFAKLATHVLHQLPPFGKDRLSLWGLAGGYALGKRIPAVGWFEAEKDKFIREVSAMIEPILVGDAQIVLPYRTERSWKSYPPAQVESEKRANERISEIMGKDLDMFFGPMFVDPAVLLSHFVPYMSKYGWSWDCLHLPRLLAFTDGVRIASVPTDFQYPRDQYDEEVANAEAMRAKRDAQSKNIVGAYEAEARTLGMI